MEMTVKEYALKWREFVADHKWVQKTYGDANQGYCILGASIGLCATLDKSNELLDTSLKAEYEFRQHTYKTYQETIIGFNDRIARSKEDVLKGLDEWISTLND